MLKFNNIFVFGQYAKLAKFNAHTHTTVVTKIFAKHFDFAEYAFEINIKNAPVKINFFVTNVGNDRTGNNAKPDKYEGIIGNQVSDKRLMNYSGRFINCFSTGIQGIIQLKNAEQHH